MPYQRDCGCTRGEECDECRIFDPKTGCRIQRPTTTTCTPARWHRGIEALLTDEEMIELRSTIDRYDRLRAAERESGRATHDEFDIEDALGSYEWLLRRIASR